MPLTADSLFLRSAEVGIQRAIVGDDSLSYQPQVPDELIRSLRVNFSIEKTIPGTPNRSTIQIYNLSEVSRDRIKKPDLLTLKAGYDPLEVATLDEIFVGNIDYIKTDHQGPDIISVFECGDGGEAIRNAKLNLSIGPNVTVPEMINRAKNAIVEQFSVDDSSGFGSILAGIVDRATNDPQTEPIAASDSFLNGQAVFDKASNFLTKMTERIGADWSVQNNNIQLVPNSGPPSVRVLNVVIDINQNNGLIDRPIRNEDGIVTIKKLLTGDVLVGSQINLESESITGRYKALRVVHRGDTHGNEWFTEIESEPL